MPSKSTGLMVPPVNIQEVEIDLIGTSPLICHNWSEDDKAAMLGKQMKKAAATKKARDPMREFEACLYHHPDGGYGFPAPAFKLCAVDACSYIDDITKVATRGAFHVLDDMVKIQGEPSPREDMVRIGGRTAMIRYRAQFPEWSTTIRVRMNPDVLSFEQLLNLYQVAGFSVGVGDWRPQKGGAFGMFRPATEDDQ